MKNPDEIKKGLECCTSRDCGGNKCPCFNEKSCIAAKSADALALIQQLESKLECSQMTIDGLTATLLKCDTIIKQLEKQNRCLKENKESYEKRMIDLAQRMPEWISMEEKHPKYNEEVLICKKVGKYKMLSVGYLGEDGCFYTGEGWFAEVTHWMPLPEPPKEPEA